MLKPQQQQQNQKQDLQRSLREEAARAVVRDAIGRGYKCIELGHDGRRPIFFCVHCGTRCYTDVALWDHLRGNVHARRVSSAAADSTGSCCAIKDQDSAMVDVKVKVKPQPSLPLLILPPPQLQFKLVDQGQIFIKIRPCSKLVEACWFEKRDLLAHSQHQFQQQNEAAYAIVVFPYGEGLGRARNWKNEKSSSESNAATVEHTEGMKRGRRRAKTVERICFICRQKMVPGKDVATLLNMNNGQSMMMMCHSRNMRGAFHVYHICCLINWILIFNAKQWMGQSLTFRRHFRNSLKTEPGELSATEVQSNACKAIFCPECQGTGVRLPGGQLERPRYRLAQIFEWVLQLVQARKVWTDHLGQETTGLLFHASKGINHPREFESSLVFPRAALRLYSTADLLDSGTSSKMEIDNATSDMETDG